MVRFAGVFPVIGLIDSHPVVEPKYRTDALKTKFDPVAKTVILWVAGVVDPAGAAKVTCCGWTLRLD